MINYTRHSTVGAGISWIESTFLYVTGLTVKAVFLWLSNNVGANRGRAALLSATLRNQWLQSMSMIVADVCMEFRSFFVIFVFRTYYRNRRYIWLRRDVRLFLHTSFFLIIGITETLNKSNFLQVCVLFNLLPLHTIIKQINNKEHIWREYCVEEYKMISSTHTNKLHINYKI